MRFIKALFSLLIVATILGGAALVGGYVWLTNEIVQPGPSQIEQVFEVKPGEGLNSIASRLEADGLIKDDLLLRLASRLEGATGQAKVGEYRLEPGLSVEETLDRLIEGKVIQHRITVPEGLTVAQAFRILAADETLVGDLPEELPPEGSLLPDTYFFSRGATRQSIVDLMRAAQSELLDELWPERQEGLPLASPYEAVILASVVEKETGLASERGQIAGLFVGRLKRGMRLQSDPTIIYGESGGEPLRDRNGNRRGIRRSEIDRVTDWNTYQIDGLPKTPIANPGRDSIAAVLQPESTDYVFFVADGTGGHRFAKTNAEHQRNVAAYRAYEREELARERAERAAQAQP